MLKPTPGSLAVNNLCLFVAIATAALLAPSNDWWFLFFSVLGIGLNLWWLRRGAGEQADEDSSALGDDPSEDERERVMQELDEEAERRRKQRDAELN